MEPSYHLRTAPSFSYTNTDSSVWTKRRRGTGLLQLPFSSSHVISQEEEEEDGDVDMMVSSPVAKRRRINIDEARCLSPSMISVASSSMDPPVEWWKRASSKQRPSAMLIKDHQKSACFVCESVFTPQPKSAPQNVMPTNSLLAYFSCSKTRSKATTMTMTMTTQPQPQAQARRPEGCTFCERVACPKCLRECEDCQKPFCSFCCKDDYYGAYTRTVCLDCFQRQEDDDHDAMQYDSV